MAQFPEGRRLNQIEFPEHPRFRKERAIEGGDFIMA